ncbi:TRAP transporter substrate-binding protein [Burkholderia thailandensis]|uniref:TRAP transporter substrate-binding protein n=1 Tax=Burkholderia thailandensis TaxID=57975 RepID=UPI001C11C801|nr:TRAP transporter substrate-binding protein [Burkholderia thailandensis]
MSMNRRAFVGVVAGIAAVTVVPRAARAAEFTYKLGHDQPITHPQHIRAVEAADKIANASGGRMVLEIYPNSQLGSDTQMVAQVRSGALEMTLQGDIILGNIVPAASLAGLPFAFAGYDELWRAMDGEFGRAIHAEIERKTGLHVMEKGWDAGFRHLFTSEKLVHSAADMKGLKLRVPAAAIDQSLFKSLGSAPTPVPSGDVYAALQTRLVDGAEGPLVTIENAKYYEAATIVSLTSHQPTPFELVVNGAAWRRLPKDLQAIASQYLNEAALFARADIANGEGGLKQRLRSQGVTLVDPDRDSFRRAVRDAGLYRQWRDSYGVAPFAMLEKVVGTLA